MLVLEILEACIKDVDPVFLPEVIQNPLNPISVQSLKALSLNGDVLHGVVQTLVFGDQSIERVNIELGEVTPGTQPIIPPKDQNGTCDGSYSKPGPSPHPTPLYLVIPQVVKTVLPNVVHCDVVGSDCVT